MEYLLAEVLLFLAELRDLLLELLAVDVAGLELHQGRLLRLVCLFFFVLVVANLLQHGFVLPGELILLVLELVLFVAFFFNHIILTLELLFQILSESVEFIFVLALLFCFLLG